jgi:hypothetical protein
MFLNSTFSAIEADAHRQALIADAESFRLAKLVRAARRRARKAARPPLPPDDLIPERNTHEERRYAVSR